ncbi:MAG TPA: BTAD domain-containing putative transcriptional regulator [Actinomycetales bacterium]|nr:BTAD domain-containing putative transcriptional regulator [Actinomycetales bacterium]
MVLATAPAAHPAWQLRLLDTWQLAQDGRSVDVPWRQQRLIAVLALQGQRPRTHVAGVLWPESNETRAMSSLRAAIWQVQQCLPGLLLEGRGPLGLRPGVRVDVHDLLSCVARNAPTGRDQSVDPDAGHVLTLLTHGDLLPGWYDDWVLFERERLQQLRLRALEGLVDRLLGAGQVDQALVAALAAVAIEPFRESAHRALIKVHLTLGNYVDALRVYDGFRQRLLQELGISPSPQITALVANLLARPRAAHGRRS